MKQVFVLREPLGVIREAEDIFSRVGKVKIDFRQENLILFCLDTKNRVLYSDVAFKGGMNSCLVDPKIIFKLAMEKGSNSIIIAHNHPSGCLEPSPEDIELFKVLRDGAKLLGMSCLDSIIFNPEEFYSIKGRLGVEQ